MALPRDAQLEAGIFAAGLLPDRTAPGEMTTMVNSAILQDADPGVRLEAILVLSELPASARGAAALRDLVSVPSNVRDRWLPDAFAIAAAKQAPDLALELLQTRLAATDSAYIAGVRTVVQFMARYHARERNTAAIVQLLAAVPQANPQLAEGVFAGIAGPAQDQRPWRVEWRTDPGGWPQEQPPTLTAEQRATLARAAAAAPAEMAEGFTRVATRWGMMNFQ
jgi:hypothetical protein